ncbi:ice-binding protein [Mycena vulgaris]|nr:ice-binding protein [Mycena vulgaris]
MPYFVPNIAYLGFLAALGGVMAAGPAPVLLRTAGNFAIVAQTSVSTIPNSAVTGNVGISPATVTSLTGFSLTQDVSRQFWTSTQVNGRLMGATDALPTPGLLTVAVLDMQTAFTDAMNRPQPNFVGLKAGLIGGSILVPGLYKWTTGVTISTGITLAGGPADTWIFQISGTLVQAANVQMTLIGGAVSKNIIWVVAGTVTAGANAVFQGNILAKTNVVMGTNAIDHGCIYAQTAVTLQKATLESPDVNPGELQCPDVEPGEFECPDVDPGEFDGATHH